MKVYTKTGDKGVTSLFGGTRKAKSDQIFDVLGTLDELNAQLGFVSSSKNKKIAKIVLQIQNDLFELGAQIANPKSVDKKASTSEFESIMDELDKELKPLTNFILPGGTPDAQNLHMARTICRRLERLLAKSPSKYQKNGVLMYVNRLSDLLFVMSRYSNSKAKVKDIIWTKK